MLRAALFSYLATVIGAGPALCCCGFGLLSSSQPSAPESEPVKAGCPHCTKPHCEDSAPAPAREKCPCQQSTNCSGRFPPALKPSDPSFDHWLVVHASAQISVSDLTSRAFADSVLTGVACHRPFWDPSDLFDLHHRLRC